LRGSSQAWLPLRSILGQLGAVFGIAVEHGGDDVVDSHPSRTAAFFLFRALRD
jgi:hypothetical protein